MRTLDNITDLVFIDSARNRSFAEKILSSHTSVRMHYAESEEHLAEIFGELQSGKVQSKNVLHIGDFKGRLIQKCPGSKGVVCCNYYLINTGFNCLYDCSYCFLNSYLNSFGMMIFSNTDEIILQIDFFLSEIDKNKIYRIGTGEFTDPLMIDAYTGMSSLLIEKFSFHKNVFLEIKTKSNNIDHLCAIKDKGSTVIAWSVNTDKNIKLHESGTASLNERLAAAKKAAEAGYYLAFHFDPVILYDGWQDEYMAVVDRLFTETCAEKIVWISIGGVRFNRDYKESARESGIDRGLTLNEVVMCDDGKFRYFKPVRRSLYQLFYNKIMSYNNPPFLYMCMESREMWADIFGRDSYSTEKLESDFELFLTGVLNKKRGC
jgi:spore photoproduct lyase